MNRKSMTTRLVLTVLLSSTLMGIALNQPALAQWSHREGGPMPGPAGLLVQPFTRAEWDASNFAATKDVQWFRDAKFGMFIHFGLSTRNKADLSWQMCQTRKAPDCGNGPIPDAVWQSYPKEFKLEKFNAKEWVEIAQRAGVKYIVAIAKHHDGFHLWDTAYSEFKITNTPFGRDYLKELADACHAAGMPFGIYYSQRDWYHPDYMPVDSTKANLNGVQWTLRPGVKSPLGDRHKKYIEYQFKVCKELCTKYGKVDIFWFDAAWWGGMFTAEMWDAENLTRMIRKLQPHIVINNRCSIPGDFDTPEQRLGHYQDWRPWESCMCLENGWSYTGAPPKPRDQILRMIINNACCDGNILLSWGPKWNGEFDAAQKNRLLEVGDWLKQNGSAIFGTRGGPWKFSAWGGSVRKGKTVYLHVVKWNGDTLRLAQIPGRKVVGAKLLGGKEVQFGQADGVVSVTVPQDRQIVPDTIVELTMDQAVDGVSAINAGKLSIFNDTATLYMVNVPRQPGLKIGKRTLAEWQIQTGTELHSIFAEPQFVNPDAGDYRVRENSPALKLGLKNFATDGYGTGDPELKPKAIQAYETYDTAHVEVAEALKKGSKSVPEAEGAHRQINAQVPPPRPYGPVPTERQVKWHEMEIYGFLHFGPNTFANREWGFGDDKPDIFQPTAFDADQIVKALKDGGLKGVILTAKHHDGYCLWPSKYTEQSVKNSPWQNGKGDVVRDISIACKNNGMKFGVYVSPWDRNHAEYGKPGYVEYYHNTIRELTTNYGPLFEMWFDGACGGDGWYGGKKGSRGIAYNTYYDWKGIREIIRKNQPDCAVWCGQYNEGRKTFWADARWGGSEGGDVGGTCWNAMSSQGGNYWGSGLRDGDSWCGAEGDVSIRPSWFYHANEDVHVKGPAHVMNIYLACVGRGANLILNIPPDKRGRIHENDVASLKLFGQHLKDTFAKNLAADAKFEASNIRGGDDKHYGPAKLVDADRWSAWISDDDVKTPEVAVKLEGEKSFNLIRLREDIRLGQRVDEAAIDAWVNGTWKEIAKAQSIGACRLWRVPETKTDKVRIRVTKATACPALSEFGLFLEPPAPAWSAKAEDRAKLAGRAKWKITASFDNPGISPNLAIDGDPNTFWHSAGYTAASGIPASMTLDLGEFKQLAGMTYLTRQDKCPNGMIDKYRIDVSPDGKTWTEAASGEFANIQANPIVQRVMFAKLRKARYLRLTALHVVASNHIAVAELNVIEEK
jgi:alpha-L-fucosidase